MMDSGLLNNKDVFILISGLNNQSIHYLTFLCALDMIMYASEQPL